MADTYKLFTSDDIIVGDTSAISNPVWSGGVGTLLQADLEMPAAVLAHEYFVPVYTPDVATGTVQFAVAYGNYDGNDTIGDEDVRDGGMDTPSKTVYKQFAQTLLDPGVTKFSLPSGDVDMFYAISVNRSRMRQKLDPGNWELDIAGTLYRDNSGAGENPNVNAGGRVFYIYEWDDVQDIIVPNTPPVGLFYPDYGVIMFDATAVGPAPGNDPIADPDPPVYLNRDFVDEIDSFQARSEERITSNYYFCRVNNRQFNFSSNPTYISGSGQLYWPVMVNDPQVYMTTIGLYNDANELVAVAKLSKPLLKNFHREALVKIKIDY